MISKGAARFAQRWTAAPADRRAKARSLSLFARRDDAPEDGGNPIGPDLRHGTYVLVEKTTGVRFQRILSTCAENRG